MIALFGDQQQGMPLSCHQSHVWIDCIGVTITQLM